MMSENAAVDLFFNLLARRSESTGFKSCPRVLLPETVVYAATVPSGGFVCTSEGYMTMKEGNKVKASQVFDSFLDETVMPLQAITSTLISVHEQEATVSYFTKDELRDFLFRQSKPVLGVLQRWPGWRVGRTRSFRVDYSPELVQLEMRTNKSSCDTLLTYDGTEYQAQTEPIKSALTRQELKLTMKAICDHIVTTSQLHVVHMVVHFTQDDQNRLWLQFCSCLRLNDLGTVGNFIGQRRPFRIAPYKRKVEFIGECENCHKMVETTKALYQHHSRRICDFCFMKLTAERQRETAVLPDSRGHTRPSLSRGVSSQGGLDKWLTHKAAEIQRLIQVDVYALVKNIPIRQDRPSDCLPTQTLPMELLAATEEFTTDNSSASRLAGLKADARKKKEEGHMQAKLAALGFKIKNQTECGDCLVSSDAKLLKGQLTTDCKPPVTATVSVSDRGRKTEISQELKDRLKRTRRVLGLDQRRACFQLA